MSWKLDKSCVSVVEFTRSCSECGENSATHAIALDLGSETVAIEGPGYCWDCAEQRAEEIRAMLPDPEPETEEPPLRPIEIAGACAPSCSQATPCNRIGCLYEIPF